ncbi:cytidylate kinase family protein [Candidatus Woesearchaeota archaeon]|nr:cytidylate kinase family protein [Candidatus Woesearchaeota archaeon]
MIIIISGLPGSGKSSVAKEVAEKLGYKHYSTGDIQREIAKEKGLTISELGKLEATDKSFDLMIDRKTKEFVQGKDNIVMDSWLAGNFVLKAVKVFLECNEDERVRRRLAQKREEESFQKREQALKDMQHRVEINRDRWKRYYNYDFLDMSNYDVVIDTSKIGIDKVVEKVLDFVEDFSD